MFTKTHKVRAAKRDNTIVSRVDGWHYTVAAAAAGERGG